MHKVALNLHEAFPSYLEKEIKLLLDNTAQNLPLVCNIEPFVVIVNNEKLHIPYRVEFDDDNLDSAPIQQHILACCYTRHHDGFVREKYVKKIISLNEEWVVPYVMQLLGEYVIEILDIIYKNLDKLDVDLYRHFISENKEFYFLTRQRVASYWSCYYRWRYKNKKDYVGFKILNYLDGKSR
ncbi:MAG: hypothetical protein K0R66_1242 [Gammaproteobacteria bacterium]|jgi:hypothetical protein|nr:hypothetical protein [Gammaproteobacteria bacterium]